MHIDFRESELLYDDIDFRDISNIMLFACKTGFFRVIIGFFNVTSASGRHASRQSYRHRARVHLHFLRTDGFINHVFGSGAGKLFDEGGYDVTCFGWLPDYDMDTVFDTAQQMHDIYHSWRTRPAQTPLWNLTRARAFARACSKL